MLGDALPLPFACRVEDGSLHGDLLVIMDSKQRSSVKETPFNAGRGKRLTSTSGAFSSRPVDTHYSQFVTVDCDTPRRWFMT
jgi:hypothetical protein